MLQIGFVFSECHCPVFRVHTQCAGAEVAAATSLVCREHKPWGSVWGVCAFRTHSGSSTEHQAPSASLCFQCFPVLSVFQGKQQTL